MKSLKKLSIQIKKINNDNLIYKYKGNTADANFDINMLLILSTK